MKKFMTWVYITFIIAMVYFIWNHAWLVVGLCGIAYVLGGKKK